MKPFLLLSLWALAGWNCDQGHSQISGKIPHQRVGGACEGCEAIYSSPVPFDRLSWTDTLPDFREPGPKLVISGTVYKSDGRTPAPGIVLYVYHTDQTGHYTNRNHEAGYAGKNGYIKGWMRTNARGQYRFYTLKPGPYPGGGVPAHIHTLIKEPGMNEYWIDEYLFENDPLLTEYERKRQEGRGGSGIISLEKRNGVLYGERNIYLGRNVPGYPARVTQTLHPAACPGSATLSFSYRLFPFQLLP